MWIVCPLIYLQTQEGEHSKGKEGEDDDVPQVLDGVDDGGHDGLESRDDGD